MRFCYSLSVSLALLAHAAYAQQPALPGAPAPVAAPMPPAPTVPVPATPASAAPASELILGHRYEVKLQSGVSFTGVLQAIAANELTFSAVGLGNLTVNRSQLVQLRDLDVVLVGTGAAVGLRRSTYYDIGSGSRYFFGPSGRNLRRGEGVAQDVLVYLGGVNYGITDNISIGGYMSLVPGLGLQNQVFVLTPKVGFEVGHDLNLGVGTMYLRIPTDNGEAIGVGLLYGVATRGSADNNVSLGVGYGYAGSSIGSTPTIYLAGQTRVSRRISLMSENYIVAAENPVFFGLYGLKINWKRVGMGIASGYIGYIDNVGKRNGYDDSFFFPFYVVPVYLDVSFRFGKPYQKPLPTP